jgi:hypothetical protein
MGFMLTESRGAIKRITAGDVPTPARRSPLPEPRPTPPPARRQPVRKRGVAVSVVASAATTVPAAVAAVTGGSFAGGTGATIPITAFAQLTRLFSLADAAITAAMARKARRPRATLMRTTPALPAPSFVPDLTFGFDAGFATTLITLQTITAVIVVPTPGAAAHPNALIRPCPCPSARSTGISPTPAPDDRGRRSECPDHFREHAAAAGCGLGPAGSVHPGSALG